MLLYNERVKGVIPGRIPIAERSDVTPSHNKVYRNVTIKICRKCGVEKTADNFFNMRRNRDGLTHWCKDCYNIQATAWRRKLDEDRILNPRPKVTSKVCNACGEEKSIDEFHHCAARLDGYKNQCKDCSVNKSSSIKIVDGKKKCTKCGEYVNLNEFHKSSTGPYGLSRWCKECTKEWTRTWNNEHRGRIKKNGSKWYYAQRGIDEQWYKEKLASQGGCCAICAATVPYGEADDKRRFAVDHDHSCCGPNKMCDKCRRGILCVRCNTWLERIEKYPGLVRRAMAYIKQYRSLSATIKESGDLLDFERGIPQ